MQVCKYWSKYVKKIYFNFLPYFFQHSNAYIHDALDFILEINTLATDMHYPIYTSTFCRSIRTKNCKNISIKRSTTTFLLLRYSFDQTLRHNQILYYSWCVVLKLQRNFFVSCYLWVKFSVIILTSKDSLPLWWPSLGSKGRQNTSAHHPSGSRPCKGNLLSTLV